MSIKNKYPNADTSPERLAEIEQKFKLPPHQSPDLPWVMIRDLLAMLQERGPSDAELVDQIQAMHEDLNALRQQLHDQRWRRLSDEEPALAEVINIKINDRDPEELAYQTIVFGVDDVEFDWWRPITPLPNAGFNYTQIYKGDPPVTKE